MADEPRDYRYLSLSQIESVTGSKLRTDHEDLTRPYLETAIALAHKTTPRENVHTHIIKICMQWNGFCIILPGEMTVTHGFRCKYHNSVIIQNVFTEDCAKPFSYLIWYTRHFSQFSLLG